MNFQNILLPNIYFPNNYFQVIRALVNEKQYICSASLGGYVHLTSNQLHSINKDKLPKPVLLRTLLLKMHHFKWMFVENKKFIRSLGVICSTQLAMSIQCWITFTGQGCNFLSNFISIFSNISCISQNAKYCFQGSSIYGIHFELGYMPKNKLKFQML